ncbi:MAG: hypothetical protein WBG37_13095 [Desulfobacterales bacterium]|jgi:hypothetical protein
MDIFLKWVAEDQRVSGRDYMTEFPEGIKFNGWPGRCRGAAYY